MLADKFHAISWRKCDAVGLDRAMNETGSAMKISLARVYLRQEATGLRLSTWAAGHSRTLEDQLARDRGAIRPGPVVKRFTTLAWVALAACTAWAPATAGEPPNVSAGEIALLPAYCADRVWGGVAVPPERRERWASMMGPSWDGLHHYCWGLVHVRRATVSVVSPQARRFMLETAVADYLFTIQHSTPDFQLLPEILMRLGEAYDLLGLHSQAIDAFERSIQTKRDYWPAYDRLAKTLAKSRLPDRAREAARRGLIAVPGNPELLALYSRLGGKAIDLPASARATRVGTEAERVVPGPNASTNVTSSPQAASSAGR